MKPAKRKPPTKVAPGWFHARVNTDAVEVKEEDVKEKELTSKIQLKKTVNLDRVRDFCLSIHNNVVDVQPFLGKRLFVDYISVQFYYIKMYYYKPV